MDSHKLIETDQEIQRLAFNLADALDTLNVHSMGEAVGDMRRTVFPISEGLQLEIRRILKNMDVVRKHSPQADIRKIERELGDMDALLDMLHKCTGEVKNYKDFVDGLIPLLRKCEAWGDAGPCQWLAYSDRQFKQE